MPSYYTYLISSLPMLHFGAPPPLTFSRFLEACRGLIPEEEVVLLKKAGIIEGDDYQGRGSATLKAWQEFEVVLRNELVRVRASRRRLDAQKYLRRAGFAEAYIPRLAVSACRNPAIMEAEKLLDEARWHKLDELSFGHYFDLDSLIIYALKLNILERWEKIHRAEPAALLEGLLAKNR